MNTVYFVRHGENPANLTREFSYRIVDYSLTEKGIQQARETARYFAETGLDTVYSSPLKRAMETAALLAAPLRLPVTVLEQFREVNVGELEGQPPTKALWAFHDGIFEQWFAGAPATRFPGGENQLDLIARMRDGIDIALRERENARVAIVTHGGILNATIQSLCPNTSIHDLETLEMGNCAITEVAFERRENGALVGTLVGWALCTHLSG